MSTLREPIKGIDPMCTIADLAQIMDRPKRWVREKIVNGRLIPQAAGGNAARFRPLDVKAWIDKGCPGLRNLQTSGRRGRRASVQANAGAGHVAGR